MKGLGPPLSWWLRQCQWICEVLPGEKEDGDPEAAGTYGFPIGKDGEIYRKGVIAAKSAAAGARSGTKNEAIYNAADKLLKLIEKKRESGDNGSDDESGNKSMEDENMDDKW